jgi:hypothetical protein
MRNLIAVFVMMFAVLAVGGCKKSNPCAELADKMCEEMGGKDSEGCKKIKEEMGDPSDDEKKQCEEMLKQMK